MTGKDKGLTVGEALAAARALHQQGRLAEAESLYRILLRHEPGHAGALHLLGLVRYQCGDLETAARLIQESVRLAPADPVVHNSLGAVFMGLGFAKEALGAFDRSLALRPDYPEALNNRGNALLELGRLAEALEAYDHALRLKLENATLHFNRGIALHRLGRLEESLDCYGRAIALAPGYVDAHVNRGEALRLAGRAQEALECFDRAIALAPDSAVALNNRGTTLVALGRLAEALASYDRAIEADPALADAHGNRGIVLVKLRTFDEALASFDQALERKPDHADFLYNRVVALLELGRYAEALADCDRALALHADRAELHHNRAITLLALRRFEEALPSAERAFALSPSLPYAAGILLSTRMHLCEWKGFDETFALLARAVRAGERACPPFPAVALPFSAADQLACARTLSRDRFPALAKPLWPGARASQGRIRLGYFSADFHNHATAHLIGQVLESHDRARFEVTAFSYGPPSDDPWRRRMAAAVERFVDVSAMDEGQIAALARQLEIDVAVDLKGYTTDSRPGILALRPAPVQACWLGFPATMGTEFMDYLIADAVVIPPGEEAHYAERIAYLPHCYFPNDSTRPISPRAFTRAEMGLPAAGFVFSCFNGAYKLVPETFGRWMRILQRVEGSVLWLLEPMPRARENLRREAKSRGVDPARLVFAPVIPADEHLARNRLAGLFLDTLPCNAHTTACDALWAGVPVLTQAGTTLAGRVAASLLAAVGLPELVVADGEAYEALACALATDPRRLAGLRERLAANRLTHPLFDGVKLAKHLEAAYAAMHERHRAGLAPARIVVPA